MQRLVVVTLDLVDNWVAAQDAYTRCAARVRHLKGWYDWQALPAAAPSQPLTSP